LKIARVSKKLPIGNFFDVTPDSIFDSVGYRPIVVLSLPKELYQPLNLKDAQSLIKVLRLARSSLRMTIFFELTHRVKKHKKFVILSLSKDLYK